MKLNPLFEDPRAVLVFHAAVSDPPTKDEFRAAGRTILEALGVELEGERAVIKPNVTSGEHFTDPDSGITTHPAFVHGLIDHLKPNSRRVKPPFILEDPRNSDDNEPRHWHGTGYPEVAAETGALLRCPNDYSCVKRNVPNSLAFPQLSVSRHAVAPGTVLINVPKLKTHNLAITTLCMKNLMGAVNVRKRHYCRQSRAELPETEQNKGRATDDWMDRDIHRRWQEGLARRLTDTARVIMPKLNIVEGIVGREGSGFQRGRNRSLGLVVAGTNIVAVDAVASYLVGFDPESLVYLDMAAKAGLGSNRMSELLIFVVEDGIPVRRNDVDSLCVDPPFSVISNIRGEAPAPF